MSWRRTALAGTAILVVLGAAGCASGPPRPPSPTSSAEPVVHVAPDGTGSACSVADPCALLTALEVVRRTTHRMRGDLVVELSGGTYLLDRAFTLTDPRDSGTGGWSVTWRAAPGATPVLSGGVPISGWSLADPAGGIWEAAVPPGLDTRQLFVDGVRATRARSADLPAGFDPSDSGFTVPGTGPLAGLASWPDVGGAEVVGDSEWKHFRCPIASAGDTGLALRNPCLSNSRLQKGASFQRVAWLENARELLDEPGEWYLDRATSELFYLPRAGEDLRTAEVVAPVLPTVLRIGGSAGSPVHDLRFQGITVAYSTWLGPDAADGYVSVQSGFVLTGQADRSSAVSAPQPTPAAVEVSFAERVDLDGARVEHTGTAGIALRAGSTDVTISRTVVDDVSGGGVIVGDAAASHPDPADVLRGNRITDCTVTRVGRDYHDASGIAVLYAAATTVAHNEVADVPYTGISVGWGWGAVDAGGSAGFSSATPAGDNLVEGNDVHDYLQLMRDGAGIYTLGSQPGTRIRDNHLHDGRMAGSAVGGPERAGGLYLDEASSHIQVTGNVVAGASSWLFLWTPSIRENTVTANWSDTAEAVLDAPANDVRDNITGLSEWPPGALAVIAAAGPR